jgi:DNA-directed RNA polymerase specialized sigma24 family protein
MEFDEFARRELPRLLRYAVVLTGDRELAQDLLQDVMMKAHAQWHRVSAAEHPDRYVHTLVRVSPRRRRWIR